MSRQAEIPTQPLGAHVEGDHTRFAAFVTTAPRCAVRLFGADGVTVLGTHEMLPLGGGYFSLSLPGVGHGALYKLVVGVRELPDPYARFLPFGVHGPARVVEARHVWRHGAGVARPFSEHVIYELHVGTFTPEGTYDAARARLPELAALGVTAIELMPVSAFAGERGWGYDGVAHFAPFAPYGDPDALRHLIDHAHGLGLSVFLDVVYNHFGPSGMYLSAFSPTYFTSAVKTPWGDAPDYTQPVMRRYTLENALSWLRDFRFDGLRLDAIFAIHDPSPVHVLRELALAAAELEPKKLLVAEDERNSPRWLAALGLDAVWADDFHHQLRVTLTREADGYYAAYRPGTEDLARTIERGWLYEGQRYEPQGRSRGEPAGDLAAERFVYCIQNHDQIGNRALGSRLSDDVSLEAYCVASALLLFLPMTPLLFMGQEWAASSPFMYFTDHEEELGRAVVRGRREEFAGFAAFADPARRLEIPDPQAEETFARSRLRHEERARAPHDRVLALYRELLRLRRTDPVLRRAGRDALAAHAVGGALVVRRWHAGAERVLLANFSDDEIGADALGAGGASCLFSTRAERWDGGLPGRAAVILSRDTRPTR